MQVPQALASLEVDTDPGFPQKHVCEQATTHADLAMDAPDRDVNPLSLECFAPSQHMLIDAVDQRSRQDRNPMT
jgi:hypothetical protein